MNDIIKNECGQLKTTSKIISDVFGKTHIKVTEAIGMLECSDDFKELNFERSFYVSPQNKKIPCYNITEDGFYFLCMGFSGKKAAKWKEEFLVTFKQMRKAVINVDAEVTRLSIEGKEIKQRGSEWSQFGRDIRKDKKSHDKSVAELISEVQFKLDV